MLLHRLKSCFSRFSSQFTDLEKFNKHLAYSRQTFVTVYFRANWNPQCFEADKQAEKLVEEFPGLQVYKIDSDLAPKIKLHYGVRAEPEFVLCYYGDQLIRHIGLNWKLLKENHSKMYTFGDKLDWDTISRENRWQPYGARYQLYKKEAYRPRYQTAYGGLIE